LRALGAAGLGFAGSNNLRHADLVVCAIPPVCVYVDLLCLHLNLKMLVIGTFLRRPGHAGNDIRRYEEFVNGQARQLTIARPRFLGWLHLPAWARRWLLAKESDRPSAFDLEDWALSLSTIALFLALIVYAFFQTSPFWLPFGLSGVAGLVTTAIGNWQFAKRFEAVRGLE
jgi:polyferredoxin